MDSSSKNKSKKTVIGLDDSGSLKGKEFQAVLNESICLLKEWVDQAMPKDKLEIIAFSPKKAAYLVQVVEHFEMPYLPIPTKKWRERLKKEYRGRLTKALARIPSCVGYTPLVEVLNWCRHFYGNRQDENWELLIISDLIQCSEKLSFTLSYLSNRLDEEIAWDMLKVAPRPKHPPLSVSIYCYPGLVEYNKAIDLETYQRLQSIFHLFFRKWKVSQISFKNLEVK